MGWDGIDQIDQLSADLRALPEHARSDARQVIKRGAVNVKRQLVSEMQTSPSFRGVASAISFDMEERAGSVEAVIGPTKGAPGSLANIAYWGSSRGGGTVPEPMGALQSEAPATARHLLDLIADHL